MAMLRESTSSDTALKGEEHGRWSSPRSRSTRLLRGEWVAGFLFVFLLGLLAAASGCATVGRGFSQEQVHKIQLGRTTKAEMLARYGLPYRRGLDDGDSTWTYLHYKFRLFGEHLKTRDLVLTFDADGHVKSYSYNSNMDD